MSVSLFKKYIVSTFVIFLITFFLEIFVFNLSFWKSSGVEPVVVAKGAVAEDGRDFYSENYELNGRLLNFRADLEMVYGETAYVSAILTDEGDKYEYTTPDHVVHGAIVGSSYCNVYPFGRTHTVTIKVSVPEGGRVNIRSITLNARKPLDIKPLRLLAAFLVIWLSYMFWRDTFFYRLYFDTTRKWQYPVIVLSMLALMLITFILGHADKVVMASPWPHHSQYQELARSLEKGSVVLTEEIVDPRLMEADNPYDTISLQVEGIPYAMDYAYYNGNYYAYFGIVPELLLYFPYHMLTGGNLPNYMATLILYAVFVVGVFLAVAGFIKRFFQKVPFVIYLMLCSAIVLGANFIYLIERPDIYNVPILSGIAFTFTGLGLWLLSLNTEKTRIRRAALFLGSLSMALVVGSRPQLAIFSFTAIILFMTGNKEGKRSLFTRETITETALFVLPYVLVAIPVCWYNAARFGNIFEFGATYSLTTNDMNHRGFNLSRLARSLYSYLFQPAVIMTDFPFMMSSVVDGKYMGKFLYEHTYGGILVANTFMASLWFFLVSGLKKTESRVRALVLFLVLSGLFVAGFDANKAGVIYRYTCDFAPAFFLAAMLLWLVLVSDNGAKDFPGRSFTGRMFYLCTMFSLIYSFLTFIASGVSVCLENDNPTLFYTIADYFNF